MFEIRDNIINNYLNSFYEPVNDSMFEFRQKCEQNHIPIILKETETFLKEYLLSINPDNILEIGTAHGYSAIFFSQILKDAKILTIEKDTNSFEIAKSNIRFMNLNNRIKVINGDASKKETFNNIDKAKYDLLFIDGAKSKYAAFFNNARTCLKNEATIICDNILLHGTVSHDVQEVERRKRTSVREMQQFLLDIKNNNKFNMSTLSLGDGIAIIHKKEIYD